MTTRRGLSLGYAAGALVLALVCVGGALAQGGGAATKSTRLTPTAPPTIPHPIYPTPCQTCHQPLAPGAKRAARSEGVPPNIPHAPWPNCQQCHIAQEKVAPFRGNTFRAATSAAKPAKESSAKPARSGATRSAPTKPGTTGKGARRK